MGLRFLAKNAAGRPRRRIFFPRHFRSSPRGRTGNLFIPGCAVTVQSPEVAMLVLFYVVAQLS